MQQNTFLVLLLIVSQLSTVLYFNSSKVDVNQLEQNVEKVIQDNLESLQKSQNNQFFQAYISRISDSKVAGAPSYQFELPDEIKEYTLQFPVGGLSAQVWDSPKWGSWWKNLKNWEKSTFVTFARYITPNTTYVGFGEWIGPTALFAAQLAKRTLSLEPDRAAYKEIMINAALNPEFNHKMTIEPMCISDKNGYIKLTGNGGSDSVIEHADNHFKKPGSPVDDQSYNVSCVTLPYYLRSRNAFSLDLFIKVDTEGAEQFLVPSWYDWLKGTDPKPTFHLSIHGGILKLSEEVKQRFVETVKLFKYIGKINRKTGDLEFLQHEGLQITDICEICEFILSDIKL